MCHQQVSGARASHPGLVSSKARGARDAHAHRVAEPLTKNSMALLFARLSQRAGLTAKPIHPSMLRDTYAIWFLQTGGNLPTLQEQLGLADPASVRRYQRFCDEQQRAEAGTQTGSEGPMTRPKPSPPPSRLLPN
ncbi:MAG TPA: tyrosine-type recombinase/integrase [Ktedonosporobacter sp.]|nr:tyrosine-type recombinase/integrase [Ktedonosporobacter sp.]